ncbi:hypothetical protein H6P81_016515 [Aristolochia fimbriata]|uniref:Uncharacterized protein n=1 Tax=Aristolochia fimbriata TaxID=158543 RepID=A0AAV7E8I8_ARIFI|nr:hypothetical protein H6P81_016515 [Aristolochia fimbriata]
MIYHARGYMDKALLGCFSAIVGRSCIVFLSWKGRSPEETCHVGETSHIVKLTKDHQRRQGRQARRVPTSEMMLHVEDPAEPPILREPIVVPSLKQERQPEQIPEPQPEQTPETQPEQTPETQPEQTPETQPEQILEPQPEQILEPQPE